MSVVEISPEAVIQQAKDLHKTNPPAVPKFLLKVLLDRIKRIDPEADPLEIVQRIADETGKDTGRVAYIGAVMDAEIFRDYSEELHLEVVLESTEKALKVLDCYSAAKHS